MKDKKKVYEIEGLGTLILDDAQWRTLDSILNRASLHCFNKYGETGEEYWVKKAHEYTDMSIQLWMIGEGKTDEVREDN